MIVDHQAEILRTFANYETAKRLVDWTAKDIPEVYPADIVIPLRNVAREVLTQAQNELIGAMYITSCAWGLGAAPGASNTEGKG